MEGGRRKLLKNNRPVAGKRIPTSRIRGSNNCRRHQRRVRIRKRALWQRKISISMPLLRKGSFTNNQECIKWQTELMDDIYEFTKAVGQDKNLKVSVVAEDDLDLSLDLDAIAEERFFHNHQECIKLRTLQMDDDNDIYEFPEAVGLSNGFPKESTSSSQVVPPGGLLELQFSDRWRFMELMEQEEMQNLLSEEIENQIEMELKEKKKTDPNWLFRR